VTTDRVVPEGVVAAITAARGLHERFGVRSPDDIQGDKDLQSRATAQGAREKGTERVL
jgi:hypothetical protein